MQRKLTEEEIAAGMTPAGGFTRAQLEAWGVPWPPPTGWRKALTQGKPMPGTEADVPPDLGPHTWAEMVAVVDKLHAQISRKSESYDYTRSVLSQIKAALTGAEAVAAAVEAVP